MWGGVGRYGEVWGDWRTGLRQVDQRDRLRLVDLGEELAHLFTTAAVKRRRSHQVPLYRACRSAPCLARAWERSSGGVTETRQPFVATSVPPRRNLRRPGESRGISGHLGESRAIPSNLGQSRLISISRRSSSRNFSRSLRSRSYMAHGAAVRATKPPGAARFAAGGLHLPLKRRVLALERHLQEGSPGTAQTRFGHREKEVQPSRGPRAWCARSRAASPAAT